HLDLHSFPTRRSSDLRANVISLQTSLEKPPNKSRAPTIPSTVDWVEHRNFRMQVFTSFSSATINTLKINPSSIGSPILLRKWPRSEEHTSELQSRFDL